MMEKQPIEVSKVISAPASEVWKSLTVQADMIQWFFEDIPSFKAELGFRTEFVVSPGERSFTHQWEILEVTPGKSITYDWSYKEYPGKGKVIFEIEDQGASSKVTVKNYGLETFPSEIPEFSRENCTGGWQYFLSRLKEFLETTQ